MQPSAAIASWISAGGVSARKRLDEEYRDFYTQIAMRSGGRASAEAETSSGRQSLRAEADSERARLQELFMHGSGGRLRLLSGPEHRYTW